MPEHRSTGRLRLPAQSPPIRREPSRGTSGQTRGVDADFLDVDLTTLFKNFPPPISGTLPNPLGLLF